MFRTACRVTFAASVAALMLIAADPMLGTWKLNTAKSKFSPGPGPKSGTVTYSQDGDWIVIKTQGVDAAGKALNRSNRYKRDGMPYPYEGPSGKGTIVVKRIDDNHSQATVKLDAGGTVNVKTSVSADGKTRTQSASGTDSSGAKINNVAVYERQ